MCQPDISTECANREYQRNVVIRCINGTCGQGEMVIMSFPELQSTRKRSQWKSMQAKEMTIEKECWLPTDCKSERSQHEWSYGLTGSPGSSTITLQKDGCQHGQLSQQERKHERANV